MRRSQSMGIRLSALLGAFYVLFLAATAPASLLGRGFLLPSGITLEQLEGTVWHGSAGKLSIASSIGPIQIQDVQWAVQWRYLLRGELALKLETAAAAGSLSVARGFGGVRLLHADLAMPATDLVQILPPLTAWQPGGEVQFQSEGFAPQSNSSGSALVLWNNASFNLSPLQDLGDYRLALDSRADKTVAHLETQSGKLRLIGDGEYSRQTGIQFSGNAQAEAPYAKELQALLATLGKDRGDGVYVFSVHLQ